MSPGAITVSTSDYWDSSVIRADIAAKQTSCLQQCLTILWEYCKKLLGGCNCRQSDFALLLEQAWFPFPLFGDRS